MRVKNPPHKLPAFLVAWACFCAVTAVNFILTPNPYQAHHSGRAAPWATVQSEAWTLHVGVLLAISLAIPLSKGVLRQKKRALFLLSMIAIIVGLSSVASSSLEPYWESYLLVIFTFSAVTLIAAKDGAQRASFSGKRLLHVFIALYVFGILLSLARPGVWGWVPLEFSRQTRGEVTLASLIGLPLLISTAYASFKRARGIFVTVAVGLVFFIEWSFVTKKTIWMTVSPIFISFIFFLLREKMVPKGKRRVAVLVLYLAFFFGAAALLSAVLLYVPEKELAEFLNHRMALWIFHWQTFLDNPFFGAGMFATLRLGYDGVAQSEIGALATFSQFGVVFGGMQVALVSIAVFRSMESLMDREEEEYGRFVGLIVLTATPLYLLEDGSRIGNVYGLVFWYAVIFFVLRRRVKFMQTVEDRIRLSKCR